MSVETLNYFSFDQGTIFELIFLNVTVQGEKKDRFQWYLVYKNKRYDLFF